MKKLLITGFSGFVSRHFLDFLYENKLKFEVLGVDVNPPKMPLEKYEEVLKLQYQQLNLLDEEAVNKVIQCFRPDYILHLASFSSVAYSWKHPAECFSNNTCIFMNLVEALRKNDLCTCRVLSVGSSEEYGNVSEAQLPLKEDMQLVPVSPYAVARVSQELMAKVLVDGYGMQIILTRSFNHIGPFQDERFVVPSFVRRILDIHESGAASGVIETGDISIVRDFLDVRDVVEAYYLLLTKGTPGEIYNICSGNGISLREVMQTIARLVGIEIENQVNPAFLRPGDNLRIVGSYDKLHGELGWKPSISMEKTLQDMIDIMKNND